MMIEKNKIAGAEDASGLADLIDRLMEEGSGHVNIIAHENGTGFAVNTVKSNDCSGIKGACCQPTELSADDDEE